jgi:predicted amidohydrolase
MHTLRIAIFQFAPRLGDPEANAKHIADRCAESQADLFITPELSLTGYDLGDEAAYLALPVEVGKPFAGPAVLRACAGAAIVGLAESSGNGFAFNSLVALEAGTVSFRHRKVYLPTYGMFDEGRFWGRGDVVREWTYGMWKIGLLVCEDFWHPGLAWALAVRGIHLLIVAAAAPGRDIQADAPDRGRFASWESWERIARVTAQVYGIHVVVANRVGVEGGITFAGGSFVVGPDGAVLARSGETESVIDCEIEIGDVERARRPASHARDEDVRTVLRAIVDVPE